MKRSTVYIEDDLHKALKVRSYESSYSVSQLVNQALKASMLEDHEDLKSFKEREGEKPMSYEEFLKKLKASGQI